MQGRLKGIVGGSILGLIFLIILYYVHRLMVDPLPEGISTYSKDIDTVYFVIYYIISFTFILVTVLLVWFIIRYRYKEGRPAIYSHGNAALELVWTAVPAMVFITLFLVSQSTWARIKILTPPGDVEVRLVAKQFAWVFRYPGPDGKFDTEDDRCTDEKVCQKTLDGDLHVPVNKVVRVYLRGTDVIHSFFVPVLRLKQDVVPGREIVTWFEAIKPGRYEIPCAELCGPGHAGMKGWLTIHATEEYEKWVQKQWPSS
ncbi:Alternative cytochrome c oxidase subunit 2 [Candidatus Entotheonellaceae bacterium PAL068K]